MTSSAQLPALPIDEHLPQILARLAAAGSLVLQAAPGAGKTTRVPAALLDSGLAGQGEVLVLEPRRLAARMAAVRVAGERGERPGETVGYQVRFDEVSSPRTRLRFLTEGMLTRRLLSDPRLEGEGRQGAKRASIVLLDEFHERHIQSDILLAMLRRLRSTSRPDLRLVVMSATLDAEPIAAFLGAPEPLTVPGRQFEVSIEHQPRPDDRPLAEQVADALGRLLERGLDGDVLVFLPGAAEIRRAQEHCARLAAAHDLLVLPLHGDLPAAAQDLAVRPARQRKVILSTNVAESSVTIDGVVAVIDSGLARVAGHSPWSGVPTLEVTRISQASAIQRAGRAGRTRPGLCLRLFTLTDFLARPAHQSPEVAREDLAETALQLHAAGVTDPRAFDWFEAPPLPALDAAESLLRRLGAISADGELTSIGREMLRYPVHPRQARLLVEAARRGVFDEACAVAALIGERDIVARPLFDSGSRTPRQAKHHSPSDLLDRLDLLHRAGLTDHAGRRRSDPQALRELGLDPAAAEAVARTCQQLRALGPRTASGHGDDDEALLISILAGYPDRVARRRAAGDDSGDLLLSAGGGATLSPRSVVRSEEYLVAIEAEERRDRSASARHLVHLASAIRPEWLIDLAADAIRETVEPKWNPRAERVEVVERMLYDNLVIDERRSANPDPSEVSRLLATAALDAGWQRFADPDEVCRFLWRVAFIGWNFPEIAFPDLGEADIDDALAELCEGRRSFAELREAASRGGLVAVFRRRLPPDRLAFLNSMAPETVNLAGRRNVRVNYEKDSAPWIASRLQDFFGMTEGPRIAGGRVPLVLRLLAPNQRPVQITTDLAGFWERTYPQVKKEMSRRYPRHQW